MAEKQMPRGAERSIPGMNNRAARFAEVEHAENLSATLKRVLACFAREKALVAAMLASWFWGRCAGSMPPACKAGPLTALPKGRRPASTVRC